MNLAAARRPWNTGSVKLTELSEKGSIMRQLATTFWQDEGGAIVSAEIILIATILVLGLYVGFVSLQQAVTWEFFDIGGALRSLDQSFTIWGLRGCKAQTFTTSYRNGNRSVFGGQMGLANGYNSVDMNYVGECDIVPGAIDYSYTAPAVVEERVVDVCPPVVEACPQMDSTPRKLKLELELEVEGDSFRATCDPTRKLQFKTEGSRLIPVPETYIDPPAAIAPRTYTPKIEAPKPAQPKQPQKKGKSKPSDDDDETSQVDTGTGPAIF